MDFQTIVNVRCCVNFGMLLANMLKNVCGSNKLIEGHFPNWLCLSLSQ